MQRRLALPVDAWELLRTGETMTSDARAYLTRRARADTGRPSLMRVVPMHWSISISSQRLITSSRSRVATLLLQASASTKSMQ